MTREKFKDIPAACMGKTFEEFKEQLLKDPECLKEYEALRPEFEVLIEFIKARKKSRLSQKELAKK